jgi:hypothetical protein
LFDTFALSENDLQVCHFDGKQFQLKAGCRHFAEFRSIRVWNHKRSRLGIKRCPILRLGRIPESQAARTGDTATTPVQGFRLGMYFG